MAGQHRFPITHACKRKLINLQDETKQDKPHFISSLLFGISSPFAVTGLRYCHVCWADFSNLRYLPYAQN